MSDEEKNETTDAPAAVEEPKAEAPDATAPEKKQGLRKERVGKVVSDKMKQTIVVEVVRRVPHPKFRKIIKRTSKFYAHDAEESASIGDKVRIVECAPISKTKRWILTEVLAH